MTANATKGRPAALSASIRLFTFLAWLVGLTTTGGSTDKPDLEPFLRTAIQKTVIPEPVIARAIKAALWNPNQTAAVISLSRPDAALAYVFIRQTDGHCLTVDISAVESGNFGKLGRNRTEYTRFETVPVRWLPRDDGCLQVVMRTRAWIGRQRYTVSEPLVIRPDGTPVWR